MTFNRIQRIAALKRQLDINKSQLRELSTMQAYGTEITVAIRRKKADLQVKQALIKGELNSLGG